MLVAEKSDFLWGMPVLWEAREHHLVHRCLIVSHQPRVYEVLQPASASQADLRAGLGIEKGDAFSSPPLRAALLGLVLLLPEQSTI